MIVYSFGRYLAISAHDHEIARVGIALEQQRGASMYQILRGGPILHVNGFAEAPTRMAKTF